MKLENEETRCSWVGIGCFRRPCFLLDDVKEGIIEKKRK